MKFNKYFLGILICALLTVNLPVINGEVSLVTDVLFPIVGTMLGMMDFLPPVGPFLAGGLGMLNLCYTILTSNSDPKSEVIKPLNKMDFLKSQSVIINSIKTVDEHVLEESERIIRELTYTIETHDFFEKMRNSMDNLRHVYVDKFQVILDPNITGVEKNFTINEMLNYGSDYRKELRSFISKYIKPDAFSPASVPVKLFYDYLLEKDTILAKKDDNCDSESVHIKFFRAFMYIAKILTDSYVLPVSAHVIQYQQEIHLGSLSDANATKTLSEELMIAYKNDMKSLLEKTKWALDHASRDIRNCGTFELIEGETFERVQFTHTLPLINHMVQTGIFEYTCYNYNGYVKSENYEIDKCNGHTDIIPFTSKLSIEVNSHERNRPFNNMKFITPGGNEEFFGHNITDTVSIKESTTTYEQCYTVFCRAYKINEFAVSTQRVSAKPGNVITGLRLRVRKNVIYIDIQEGTFIDAITVDPNTVEWTITPENKTQVLYLSSRLRKIQLGDFELKKNTFLTTIQLKPTFLRKGLLKVFLDGQNFIYSQPSSLSQLADGILILNELKLSEADDPEKIEFNLKQMITKPPVKNEPYFVSFQPSDFKKDFGRTTVPYLDIREVITDPPAPIGGVGLYHEAVSGSGGLIGLKLITPRLTELIDFKQIKPQIDNDDDDINDNLFES